MDRSDTFAIIKGLTRHKHILFHLGSESRLAGHKSKVITDMVMCAGVEALIAETSMSTKGALPFGFLMYSGLGVD